MKLRHLRYLVAVADAGTIGRAAEQLHVAQPALSRQLRDLAAELEVPLLAAGARRATLTPAGRVGVSIARDVIRDAARAVHRARLSQHGLAGACVLAAGPLAVRSGCLARLVARVKAKYPGIELSVIEAGAHAQWDALARAEADIGLGVPRRNRIRRRAWPTH
jgi:DNA-binding transcriptional LysR family regulator